MAKRVAEVPSKRKVIPSDFWTPGRLTKTVEAGGESRTNTTVGVRLSASKRWDARSAQSAGMTGNFL